MGSHTEAYADLSAPSKGNAGCKKRQYETNETPQLNMYLTVNSALKSTPDYKPQVLLIVSF